MLHDLIQSKDFSVLILACLFFFSFFFLIRAVLLFLINSERLHQRRIKERLRWSEGLDSPINARTLLKKASLKRSIMDESLDKIRLINNLQNLMIRGDLSWKMSTFLMVTAVLGLAGFVGGIVKLGFLGGLAGGALGVLIPYRILVWKSKKRLQQFEQQLPGALDLLARSLKAGHAFPSGLQHISKEVIAPLGKEFSIVYSEFSHGMNLNTALLSLSKRLGLKDLNFFTTAVIIQRETGGNLTEILEKIAVLIRERFQLRNQIKALTAEGRLSGIILLLLPPVLLLVMMYLNPTYISTLINNPTGRIMGVVAVMLQLLGMLMIRKIVNIKV
jgi:tight adherence protein B